MRLNRFLGILVFPVCLASAQSMPAEYDGVLKTLGKQGDFKANVLKINIPRNDLKVTIDGIFDSDALRFWRVGGHDQRRSRK